MKLFIALLLLVAISSFGAQPSYTVFRGTGGIAVTTNPPTGLIVIDGSGVFTSSGTNATIAVSTNGVLIAAASTNINFTPGNNMVLKGTNTTSRSHVDYGIKSNLSFFANGNEVVLGNWGIVMGLSNAATTDFVWTVQDPAASSDILFGGIVSADNANFNSMPGTGDFVGIGAGGTLHHTNAIDAIAVNLLTYILPVLVVDSLTSTNLASSPPTWSVQFNSNNVTRGSPNFLFSNNLVVLPTIASNATPVALLGTDAGGRVYETAIPTVGSSPETNAVLTNLIGTVTRNVTNVVSLSTSNATSKPLTNSYTAGVLTLPGIEAGTNVIIYANGSNYVINSAVGAGSFSVSGNSNQIPYLDMAGTGFIFGSSNRVAPGFGFSRRGAHPALMIHEDLTNTYSLVSIGPPGYASDITSFTPSLVVSNRYAYSGSGNKHTQEMVRAVFVDVTDGSDPESFIQTWRYSDGSGGSTLSAGVRKDGQLTVAHGTMYPSNALSGTMPTAAQLGPGGHWTGVSNNSLVAVYSLNGTTTAMKVLVP